MFGLFCDGQLPKGTRIVGYARSDLDNDKFYTQVTGGLSDDVEKSKVEEFKKLNRYVKGAYDNDEAFQVSYRDTPRKSLTQTIESREGAAEDRR